MSSVRVRTTRQNKKTRRTTRSRRRSTTKLMSSSIITTILPPTTLSITIHTTTSTPNTTTAVTFMTLPTKQSTAKPTASHTQITSNKLVVTSTVPRPTSPNTTPSSTTTTATTTQISSSTTTSSTNAITTKSNILTDTIFHSYSSYLSQTDASKPHPSISAAVDTTFAHSWPATESSNEAYSGSSFSAYSKEEAEIRSSEASVISTPAVKRNTDATDFQNVASTSRHLISEPVTKSSSEVALESGLVSTHSFRTEPETLSSTISSVQVTSFESNLVDIRGLTTDPKSEPSLNKSEDVTSVDSNLANMRGLTTEPRSEPSSSNSEHVTFVESNVINRRELTTGPRSVGLPILSNSEHVTSVALSFVATQSSTAEPSSGTFVESSVKTSFIIEPKLVSSFDNSEPKPPNSEAMSTSSFIGSSTVQNQPKSADISNSSLAFHESTTFKDTDYTAIEEVSVIAENSQPGTSRTIADICCSQKTSSLSYRAVESTSIGETIHLTSNDRRPSNSASTASRVSMSRPTTAETSKANLVPQSFSSVATPTASSSKAREPVGTRRTKTMLVTSALDGRVQSTVDGGGGGGMSGVSGDETNPVKVTPLISDATVVTIIVVVVVGVVVMTIVITIGVVVVKAKRTRNRLLLEKRLVVAPPADRGINSYNYSPFEGALGGGGGGGGSTTSCSDDGGEGPSSSSASSSPFSRAAANRSSSFKPILSEDALALNNIYSTVVGDYENLNTYEIIEDSFI